MRIIKILGFGSLIYLFIAILLRLNLFLEGLFVFLLFIPYLIKRYKIFNKTLIQQQFKQIHNMSGYEFEKYLKQLFKSKNYKVKHTPLSNDQGADLIVEKDNIVTVIQAKRYSKPVGNKAVQEVIAARGYYNCHKAIVITNNRFTKSAKDLARKCDVELFDYNVLKQIV